MEEQVVLEEKGNDGFQTESAINLYQSIHLFNKYLLSIHHVPGTVLGSGHSVVITMDKVPILVDFTSIVSI